MPEIHRPLKPSTMIEVESDGHISRYFVPFSKREVEAIAVARRARNALWEKAKEGSIIARELYVNAPIPWGFDLQNRQKALDKIKCSVDIYKKVLENQKNTEETESFRILLQRIDRNLSSLLPQIIDF